MFRRFEKMLLLCKVGDYSTAKQDSSLVGSHIHYYHCVDFSCHTVLYPLKVKWEFAERKPSSIPNMGNMQSSRETSALMLRH